MQHLSEPGAMHRSARSHPQHRIYPVAGVEDQVLPHPGKNGREDREQAHADGDDYQGALGTVHDHFVDHHLCEYGRTECQELNECGRYEDVAPDPAVFQQFWDKPSKAEGAGSEPCAVGVFNRGRYRRELIRRPDILLTKLPRS
jgi:hypothetical protein